jgi:hypothetical protein
MVPNNNSPNQRAASHSVSRLREPRRPDKSHSPRSVATRTAASHRRLTPAAARCRRKFLQFYPGGFQDPDYIELERSYKWKAHERWRSALDRTKFKSQLREKRFREIATTAVSIESRTNLLFSFEKMAIRDAIKPLAGARTFAIGLYDYLYGPGNDEHRFERWCDAVASLPRRQTRVLTWPVITVFPFIARPDRYIFLKPNVTKKAAHQYEVDFEYASRPNWGTYASLLAFAERIRRDMRSLKPRDMIDLQGFIWVLGSDEYED